MPPPGTFPFLTAGPGDAPYVWGTPFYWGGHAACAGRGHTGMWGVLAEGPCVLGGGLEGVRDPACAWGCKFQGGWGSNPLGWVHGGVQGSVLHWLGLVGVIGVSVWKDQSQSCFLDPRQVLAGAAAGAGGDPRASLGHEGDASPGRCLGSGPISVGEVPGWVLSQWVPHLDQPASPSKACHGMPGAWRCGLVGFPGVKSRHFRTVSCHASLAGN